MKKIIPVTVGVFFLVILSLLSFVKSMRDSTDIRRYAPVFNNGIDIQLVEAEDGMYLSVKKKSQQGAPTVLQAFSLNPEPTIERLDLQLVKESDSFTTYQVVQPVQKSGINPDCVAVYDGETLLKHAHISLSRKPRLGEKWMCSSIDFKNLRKE